MADPLTLATVLLLAAQCTDIDPNLIAGIAKHESGFVPDATHQNDNGSVDHGIMQINNRNFAMLGLAGDDWKDPCRNMRAASDLLHMVSRYNTGSPTRGLAPCAPGAPPGCGYTMSTIQAVWKVKGAAIAAEPIQVAEAPQQPACAPSWDVWRQVACRKQQGGSP